MDKENDGVWPSVRRPVDPQRALQGLRAERAEGDEIDAPVPGAVVGVVYLRVFQVVRGVFWSVLLSR